MSPFSVEIFLVCDTHLPQPRTLKPCMVLLEFPSWCVFLFCVSCRCLCICSSQKQDEFARAALKYYQQDLNTRNVFSHSSGGYQFKIKVSAGLVPSQDSEGKIVLAFSSASRGLLATLGIFWLLLHHRDLCLHVHMVFSFCVSLCSNFPFI